MRPDVEDYEDLADEADAPRSRAMSWLVLVIAVGGFAALASYAYRSGKQSVSEGDMLVVEADPSPIKQAPVDAEGEQFPNQDKTIYNVISPTDNAAGAEKLLPDPEQPYEPSAMEADEDATPAEPASSYVKSTPVDPVDAKAMQQPAPAVAAEQPKPSNTMPTSEEPVTAGAGAPTMVNEKPAAPAKPVVAEAPAKPVVATPAPTKPVAAKPATATKPAAAPASGGSYQIQLGAFKSDADARATWSKISTKYSLSGAPTIVKADVNGNTFYRLRSGSYVSAAAAKAACAKLAGQACIPVGK